MLNEIQEENCACMLFGRTFNQQKQQGQKSNHLRSKISMKQRGRKKEKRNQQQMRKISSQVKPDLNANKSYQSQKKINPYSRINLNDDRKIDFKESKMNNIDYYNLNGKKQRQKEEQKWNKNQRCQFNKVKSFKQVAIQQRNQLKNDIIYKLRNKQQLNQKVMNKKNNSNHCNQNNYIHKKTDNYNHNSHNYNRNNNYQQHYQEKDLFNANYNNNHNIKIQTNNKPSQQLNQKYHFKQHSLGNNNPMYIDSYNNRQFQENDRKLNQQKRNSRVVTEQSYKQNTQFSKNSQLFGKPSIMINSKYLKTQDTFHLLEQQQNQPIQFKQYQIQYPPIHKEQLHRNKLQISQQKKKKQINQDAEINIGLLKDIKIKCLQNQRNSFTENNSKKFGEQAYETSSILDESGQKLNDVSQVIMSHKQLLEDIKNQTGNQTQAHFDIFDLLKPS